MGAPNSPEEVERLKLSCRPPKASLLGGAGVSSPKPAKDGPMGEKSAASVPPGVSIIPKLPYPPIEGDA